MDSLPASQSVRSKIIYYINIGILLFANIWILYDAYKNKESANSIVFSYLIQSLILMTFSVIKILTLKKYEISQRAYSTPGIWSKVRTNNNYSKLYVASNLLVFFMVFTFVLLMFFIFGIRADNINAVFVIKNTALFLISALFSFTAVKQQGEAEFIDAYFYKAMIRVLPLHLTMFLGFLFLFKLNILVFVILKTVIDLYGEGYTQKESSQQPVHESNLCSDEEAESAAKGVILAFVIACIFFMLLFGFLILISIPVIMQIFG
jgi:hypothetical protein